MLSSFQLPFLQQVDQTRHKGHEEHPVSQEEKTRVPVYPGTAESLGKWGRLSEQGTQHEGCNQRKQEDSQRPDAVMPICQEKTKGDCPGKDSQRLPQAYKWKKGPLEARSGFSDTLLIRQKPLHYPQFGTILGGRKGDLSAIRMYVCVHDVL